jgi:transposase
VSDGRLTIDNNVSERPVRLQAIEGIESGEAGQQAVVLSTFLAGQKRLRLEPWAYVRDVLLRLGVGERGFPQSRAAKVAQLRPDEAE